MDGSCFIIKCTSAQHPLQHNTLTVVVVQQEGRFSSNFQIHVYRSLHTLSILWSLQYRPAKNNQHTSFSCDTWKPINIYCHNIYKPHSHVTGDVSPKDKSAQTIYIIMIPSQIMIPPQTTALQTKYYQQIWVTRCQHNFVTPLLIHHTLCQTTCWC